MRGLLIIFSILFFSCQNHNKKADNKKWSDQERKNIVLSPLEKTARYNSFDTIVSFVFTNVKDSAVNECQKQNMVDFLKKEYMLTAEIEKKIFEWYKDGYPNYKIGWTSRPISNEELERYLPTPSNPEKLRRNYYPVKIHLQKPDDCKNGTFGIEFDCTWDIETGLGIAIKDWKVIKAGFAEVAYYAAWEK